MNEEAYQLTPLGLLTSKFGSEAKFIIEIMMDYCKHTDNNAIVFDEFPGQFINVEFNTDWDKAEN